MSWPSSAGLIVATSISGGSPARVRITHMGEDLGVSARELLSRALATGGTGPEIEEHALRPIDGAIGDEARWLAQALQLVERVHDISTIHLCVSVPRAPAKQKLSMTSAGIALTREALQRAVEGNSRVTISDGVAWRVVPTLSPCEVAVRPPR